MPLDRVRGQPFDALVDHRGGRRKRLRVRQMQGSFIRFKAIPILVTVALSIVSGPGSGNVLGQDPGRFHYNVKTGVCENDVGKTGLNPISLAEIEKTKDA